MSTPSDILKNMLSVSDEQIDNINNSIDQIQEQIDNYMEEINGIENGVCDVSKDNLSNYLDSTKVIEFENILLEDCSVEYGSNYGLIDYNNGGITDFRILDSTGNIIYEYNGIGWDNDTIIIKHINDFAFGNDYLTRPLISGATYGLYDNVSSLNNALQLLNQNKNKIISSKTIFKDFI